MKYFIAINGKVYAEKPENKWIPHLDIDNNLFNLRDEAWLVAHNIEEYNPMIFYGKPITKEGLRLYARGDSTATYKIRT